MSVSGCLPLVFRSSLRLSKFLAFGFIEVCVGSFVVEPVFTQTPATTAGRGVGLSETRVVIVDHEFLSGGRGRGVLTAGAGRG